MKKIFVILLLHCFILAAMEECKESIEANQSEKEYLQSLPPVPTTWLNSISAKDIDKNIIPVLQESINNFLIGDNIDTSPEFVAALNVKLKSEAKISDYKVTSDNKFLIVDTSNCFDSFGEKIHNHNPINRTYIVSLQDAQKIYIIDHEDNVNQFEVTTNDNYVITSSGNVLTIFDLYNGSETRIQHEDKIAFFEISPKNNFVATVSNNRAIKIIDLQTKQEMYEFMYESHPQHIKFNPQENKIVTFSYNRKLYIYDLHTQQSNSIMSKVIDFRDIQISPNGKFLLINSREVGMIQIYHMDLKKVIKEFRGNFSSFKISTNSKFVIFSLKAKYGQKKQVIKVYDLEQHKTMLLWEELYADEESFNEHFYIEDKSNSDNILSITKHKAKLFNLENQKEFVLEFDSPVEQILFRNQKHLIVRTEKKSIFNASSIIKIL